MNNDNKSRNDANYSMFSKCKIPLNKMKYAKQHLTSCDSCAIVRLRLS